VFTLNDRQDVLLDIIKQEVLSSIRHNLQRNQSKIVLSKSYFRPLHHNTKWFLVSVETDSSFLAAVKFRAVIEWTPDIVGHSTHVISITAGGQLMWVVKMPLTSP
jgi:hypothetical protein